MAKQSGWGVDDGEGRSPDEVHLDRVRNPVLPRNSVVHNTQSAIGLAPWHLLPTPCTASPRGDGDGDAGGRRDGHPVLKINSPKIHSIASQGCPIELLPGSLQPISTVGQCRAPAIHHTPYIIMSSDILLHPGETQCSTPGRGHVLPCSLLSGERF